MRRRVLVSTILLVVFCLGSSWRVWIDLQRFQARGPDYRDQMTLYEDRFQEVREQLPERGIVGYRAVGLQATNLGDRFACDMANGKTYYFHPKTAYFWAQYALAPVIASDTNDAPLIIENAQDAVRVIREEKSE